MSGRKYVWRKDHGYFTFAEVVCGTRGHLSKLGLQIIRDFYVYFQSTKQLFVHDGGQYLVLWHGDQTIVSGTDIDVG
jgi:hypothetical protein